MIFKKCLLALLCCNRSPGHQQVFFPLQVVVFNKLKCSWVLAICCRTIVPPAELPNDRYPDKWLKKTVSNSNLIVSIYSNRYPAHVLQLICARSPCQKLSFFSLSPPAVVSLMLHVANVDSIKKHDLWCLCVTVYLKVLKPPFLINRKLSRYLKACL